MRGDAQWKAEQCQRSSRAARKRGEGWEGGLGKQQGALGRAGQRGAGWISIAFHIAETGLRSIY